ncbi:bifunctional 2',3'-cyclic-nucleotide 2'-phosphodiesterase/3'-nucleotidase [Pseudoduganella danionis]|uniref:Bifunctional 2',3'-cyclic-nucleotide 2'-phosphodiesterase/3'-nucleotidase n=1 Tax=Pseudoduganella danionis TaxID=1890295 RepID=A0ABW9SKR4_9BURK|nr:bifunctional 2',3'-cyclic-nucleotide 2'-phosphodiesterase/3'-nucleotidase [Pseudoduganella danionis]MTW32762.1 bifunctional 2',3'-cyclic-nucleotide 2'-phosphodiesterase/3'-nucleotidase [Pseudoduganella danionis]
MRPASVRAASARPVLRARGRLALLPALLATCLSACVSLPREAAPPAGSRATLAVLETTDLHANLLGYDYYKLKADPSIGLERTATLIARARSEFPNHVLLDNGDAIQGTALADYQALVAPLPCNQTLAVYKAMNQLGYDGGGIGNHEFNYGLAYLNQVTASHFEVDGVARDAARCAGPAFPLVLANIYSSRTHAPLFPPYRILQRQISAMGPDGAPVRSTLRIGIIGFTPPGVLQWDQRALEGKVYAQGVREAALQYIPLMREQGADLVIALVHGGLDGAPYTAGMEDAGYYLAQVPGVDVLLMGHAHQSFPQAASTLPAFNLPGVDKVRGRVHGVPAVMANLWGKDLGVIGLWLRYDGQRWLVDRDATTVEVRSTRQPDRSYVPADAALAQLVGHEHEATIRYVQSPVGHSDFRMSSYFADVGDSTAIQVVNQAQTAYVQRYVEASHPVWGGLPVLSMASPFKVGAAGAADYTDVLAGGLALNNVADLYLYPNALHVVRVNGAELKAWLEKSAERFNRIDPASTAVQELVNPAVPGFNFDMLTDADVSYQIDISKPVGQRIIGLSYRGAGVLAEQPFLVATNNYRASGGGAFPALDGSRTVLAAPDASRDVLISYIRERRQLNRSRDGAQRSWRFAPLKTRAAVVFHSAPQLQELAEEAGLRGITQLKNDDGGGKGLALYAIDLSL